MPVFPARDNTHSLITSHTHWNFPPPIFTISRVGVRCLPTIRRYTPSSLHQILEINGLEKSLENRATSAVPAETQRILTLGTTKDLLCSRERVGRYFHIFHIFDIFF